MNHLKKFNESDEFEQRKGESSDDYIKRLCSMGDNSVNNLKQTFSDMKKDNVIGFCKHCGCDKYADIEHKCEVEESFSNRESRFIVDITCHQRVSVGDVENALSDYMEDIGAEFEVEEVNLNAKESFQSSSIGELGYDELVELFIQNGIDRQTSGRLAESISDAGGVSTVLNILSNI